MHCDLVAAETEISGLEIPLSGLLLKLRRALCVAEPTQRYSISRDDLELPLSYLPEHEVRLNCCDQHSDRECQRWIVASVAHAVSAIASLELQRLDDFVFCEAVWSAKGYSRAVSLTLATGVGLAMTQDSFGESVRAQGAEPDRKVSW